MFEGYLGIRIGDFQLVSDTMFSILLVLLAAFALIFNFHSRQFIQMIKNVVQIKQRKSLFEITLGNLKGSEQLFHFFMIFQALFLCALFLFYGGIISGHLPIRPLGPILMSVGGLFLLLVIFYFFKQGIYALFGWIFMDQERFRLWKVSYLASTELWGVLLYIPVLLAFFCDIKPLFSFLLFLFLYIFSRFVIFYKSIRIFQIKKEGLSFFFLYLCGQEIMPLFLLFKGTEFLYNFIELSTLWR